MPIARPKQLATRLLRQSLVIIWLTIIALLSLDIMIDYKTHRSDTLSQIQRQVTLINQSLASALADNNTLLAQQTLQKLLSDPRIYRAQIQRASSKNFGSTLRQSGVNIDGQLLKAIEFPITSSNATLLLDIDMQVAGYSFFKRSVAMVIITILAVSLIAGLLYLLFERRLTHPLNTLIRKINKIDAGKVTSLPVIKGHENDEIGRWIDTTNQLLESVKDIRSKESEAKANASRLRRFDELTDLPNRQYFHAQLRQRINLAKNLGQKPALLVFGMDGFSAINARYGNAIGDKLLMAVTKRLTNYRGQSQFISRISGDQFALLCEHINNSYDAGQLAQSLLHALSRPFGIGDQRIQISASVGIALYPQDGKTAELLMANADKAMLQAKKEGRNQFQYYLASTDAKMRRRKALEDALRIAPKTQQLSLVYQPQFCLEESKVTGAEALLRWKHPDYGMVSPVEFIPIAEDSNLIIPIGAWVLQNACQQLAHWHSKGEKNFQVAVNLSAVQLKQPSIVRMIENAVEEHNINPSTLILEITETAVIDNIDASVSTLEEIHELGVKIALDDFGTGYSSLNYLKRLPLNKIKIDKSFIDDVTEKKRDGMIVQSIIQLAHNLELSVVAEGVESFAQHEFLRNLNCKEGQGYFYSPPLKSAEFENLIFDNEFITTEEASVELE
ncbi:MAG: GGDEF-domain containing protein [Gammaproteobacteria bacterium]|nr:MAG: GGDEF-domain containing protein [Gammaproteobacteria bacterium]